MPPDAEPTEATGPVGPGGYLPFDDRPFRLRMGLRPLDLAAWIEVDEAYDDELRRKAELVASRPDDVVGQLDAPAVAAATEELWELVGAVAPRPCPDDALTPIARCGLSTQEDWVVMAPVDGEVVLAAACVCFPSRWVLRDKLGRSNRAIHAPIAHYDEHLADPVDRFFERLSADAPMWRLNWNLFDDPALFQPTAPDRPADAGPDGRPVGERVWLRVERQTLRRLPRTGAVAFGIRVHQQPVAALADRPDALARLGTAVRALSPETFAYKGLAPFAEDLLAWIDQKSRSSSDSMPRSAS